MTASWTEAKRCCLVMDASKKCPASSWLTTGAVGEEQGSPDSESHQEPQPQSPAGYSGHVTQATP